MGAIFLANQPLEKQSKTTLLFMYVNINAYYVVFFSEG